MNNTETVSSIFDEPKQLQRKDLLPGWIRSFCWIVIIGSAFIILCFWLIIGLNVTEMPEWENQGNMTFMVIFMSATIVIYGFKIMVAIGLLRQASWAVVCGLVDAIMYLLICLFVLYTRFILGNGTEMTTPFLLSIVIQTVLLIPYIIILYRIKDRWKLAMISK